MAIDRRTTRLGVLGSHVFGSPLDFRIDLRIGAGAFVCGEETALMASIMGERGTPRPRPPYPAESGLWGCPTLINNVETFANVPAIIRKGPEWFAGIGTARSKGTKVFSLTGKVRNTGLVEVPLGTHMRRIVEEIGGGAPAGPPGVPLPARTRPPLESPPCVLPPICRSAGVVRRGLGSASSSPFSPSFCC